MSTLKREDIPEQGWTLQQLTGLDDAPADMKKGKGVAENPMLWGIPGHLTPSEVEVFEKFRAEVYSRGGEFLETVYSFGKEEGEVWALCRWLRARKFVYDDVVAMIEEATKVRKEAKSHDFYPNSVDALGVDQSLFFSQYPQLYTGKAKNGAPLFISKPGILNVEGVECLTTLDGIIKFHWYVMMHDFAKRLRAEKEKNPDFKRFECFCVLDLNKLTMSALSSRALAITKEQAAIDSICFPETMSKMIIVNAPTFFAATWRIIKGWLDPRTASKIEVISSNKAMQKRLLELIDEDKLPVDYGGKGEHTEETLANSHKSYRLITNVVLVRSSASDTIDVKAGESVKITVHTRSVAGAKFVITSSDSKQTFVKDVEVKHDGKGDATEVPTHFVLNENTNITGPVQIKVKITSNSSRFSSDNFFLEYQCMKQ